MFIPQFSKQYKYYLLVMDKWFEAQRGNVARIWESRI